MFERFKSRSYELERIDTGDYTDAEYEQWQREMPWIHGFFGEVRALENSLLKAVRASSGRSVSILDVGAGSGTLLETLRNRLAERSSFLVGAEKHMSAAASIAARGLASVRCDAQALPFADRCFDHAICTLTLHHLNDDEAVRLLGEMARVSRGPIFAIDLNRDPLAYFAYRALAPLVLQRLTVEDGALSILRSFRKDELVDLAQRAGLRDITVEGSRMNRLILSGRKA
jgi:ubiquinone/menaquinone biosynthesis C-methylase UbiE